MRILHFNFRCRIGIPSSSQQQPNRISCICPPVFVSQLGSSLYSTVYCVCFLQLCTWQALQWTEKPNALMSFSWKTTEMNCRAIFQNFRLESDISSRLRLGEEPFYKNAINCFFSQNPDNAKYNLLLTRNGCEIHLSFKNQSQDFCWKFYAKPKATSLFKRVPVGERELFRGKRLESQWVCAIWSHHNHSSATMKKINLRSNAGTRKAFEELSNCSKLSELSSRCLLILSF